MAATRVTDCTRELGDSTSSSVVVPNNINELLWEEKNRSLREFTSNYRLPLAVKLKAGDISKYFTDNSSSSSIISRGIKSTASPGAVSSYSSSCTSQMKFPASTDSTSGPPGLESKVTVYRKSGQDDVVLQIHETRRKKIILARRMTWDKRQNDYVVTGEQVEIPASVKGWLEVVPEHGRPVEYFDTIDGITSIKPQRFLVRTSTVGYQLTTEDNGNSCWMPQEIKPGEVLTTGIVYVDSKKNKSSVQKNIFKRLLKQNKVKKEQDLKYLQCFDSSGLEIMIPLIMSGVFSPVGDSSCANYDAVYEFQDLIMAFGLPVNAQLIHVNTKESFQCPRGVIRLYGTREEELVIVSKVGPDGNLFHDSSSADRFEIPVDNELLFCRGVTRKKTTAVSTPDKRIPLPRDQKIASTCKPEIREIKNKELVTDMSKNKYCETSHQPRGQTLLNDKTTPSPNSYYSAYAPSLNENTDMNCNKLNQQTTVTANETPILLRTISSEPKPQLSSTHLDSPVSKLPEQNLGTGVELPAKAPKEMKSRSSSILEKLSVRKVKKERAKLKELRSDDVFSKRISRNELSYQDFFNGLDDEGESPKNSDYGKSKQDDSGCGNSGGTYQSSSSNNSGSVYSSSTLNTPSKASSKIANDVRTTIQRRASIQKRDLPPIPLDSPEDSDHGSPHQFISLSKESLYEHLPPAPQPPYLRRSSESALLDNKYSHNAVDDEQDDEDGYMLPRQVQQESRYVKRSNVQLRPKPPGITSDSSKSARTRKTRSEIPDEFVQTTCVYDSNCPLDIDDLFNFTYSSKDFGESRPLGTFMGPAALSTSQLYGTPKVPEWRLKIAEQLVNSEQSFVDNLDLDARSFHHGSRHKSRISRNMNANPNATIRSHNLRRARASVKEAFPFQDNPSSQSGFHGFQDIMHNSSDQQNTYAHNSRPQLFNSHSIDTTMTAQRYPQEQFQNFRGTSYGISYVESEPCFRPNSRAYSVGGVSDAYFQQGDDSAISVCSRGEAGYPNGSEYSYNVYMERPNIPDDGWTPPDQIEALSVLEVSKSLRYIGMKDRVVLRFSKEQIDGSMLCSLDEKLLKEGFPELNALEVKKIVDFIRGWRPKKC